MGNIVLVTDESGAEAARYRYTPFGREIHREGDYEARYRFSSKEFDPETGLVYYGFRHYSPALGRWINRDPIGELGGINAYRFVANAIPQAVDAFGLRPLWVSWAWMNNAKAADHAETFRRAYDSVPRDCKSAGLCEKPDRNSRQCDDLRSRMDDAHRNGNQRGIDSFMEGRNRLHVSVNLATFMAKNQRSFAGSRDMIREKMLADPLFKAQIDDGGDELGLSRVYDWILNQMVKDHPEMKAYPAIRSQLGSSFNMMRDQFSLLQKLSSDYTAACCCPCP